MKPLLDSLKALGPARLLGIAGVGLAVLAIIGFVALRGSTQPMALLYSDLELRDSAQVAAAHLEQRLRYEVRDGGGPLRVPEGAAVIDTSELGIGAVLARMLAEVRAKAGP